MYIPLVVRVYPAHVKLEKSADVLVNAMFITPGYSYDPAFKSCIATYS